MILRTDNALIDLDQVSHVVYEEKGCNPDGSKLNPPIEKGLNVFMKNGGGIWIKDATEWQFGELMRTYGRKEVKGWSDFKREL